MKQMVATAAWLIRQRRLDLGFLWRSLAIGDASRKLKLGGLFGADCE